MLADLKELIDAWLKDRPTRNLSLLSRQSGVPYPTLRRVYQQENVPTLETVLALLNVIAPNEAAMNFLNRHFSDIGAWVGKMVHSYDVSITNGDFNEELRDRISFALITLASCGGTTMEIISRKFGEYGLVKLKRLLEIEAVYEQDGILRCRYENFSVLDPRLILEQIKHTVDLFDMTQLGSPAVCAQLHTDGLDQQGVGELHRRIMEFEEDLRQIFNRYRGPHVVMLSYISSFLQKGTVV